VESVQLQDFSASHARMEREHDNFLQPSRGDGEQSLLFLRRQPPLDQIADLLIGDLEHGIVGRPFPLPLCELVGVA
jgi:hypothetical protein